MPSSNAMEARVLSTNSLKNIKIDPTRPPTFWHPLNFNEIGCARLDTKKWIVTSVSMNSQSLVDAGLIVNRKSEIIYGSIYNANFLCNAFAYQ